MFPSLRDFSPRLCAGGLRIFPTEQRFRIVCVFASSVLFVHALLWQELLCFQGCAFLLMSVESFAFICLGGSGRVSKVLWSVVATVRTFHANVYPFARSVLSFAYSNCVCFFCAWRVACVGEGGRVFRGLFVVFVLSFAFVCLGGGGRASEVARGRFNGCMWVRCASFAQRATISHCLLSSLLRLGIVCFSLCSAA